MTIIYYFLFQVEKIVARRTGSRGDVQYLIRWKDYSPANDTWEPKQNLEEDCSYFIEQFEAEIHQQAMVTPFAKFPEIIPMSPESGRAST